MTTHRLPQILVLALVSTLSVLGCSGGGSSAELGPGAYVDEHVPDSVREALEDAAEGFYATVRAGDPQTILNQVAYAARPQMKPEEFIGSVQRIATIFGMPDDPSTDSVALVKFGPGFAHSSRVRAPVEGVDDDAELLLTDYPDQASLVQTASVGGEKAYFSTLWFYEEAEWRLASFFAKPATMVARGWREYSEEAASQRLAKNTRNAALLYNLAIDLAVPAAWIKPAAVAELQRAQKRIMVSNMPTGKPEVWGGGAAPDSFTVARVGYGWIPEGLTVRVQYEATGADSVAEAPRSELLRDFVLTTFPEYREVFQGMTVVAVRPEEGSQVLARTFLWKDGP